MKKFVVLARASKSAMEQMKNVSPEDAKKGMEQWMIWAKKAGDGLVDLGSPLGNGQVLSESGSSPSDADIVGYMILQAKDMDGALDMLKDHPHLGWAEGCNLEVYESLPLP